MAPGKVAVDFDAIINADRQRRKNEALAQQIFSKNRRSSAPGVDQTIANQVLDHPLPAGSALQRYGYPFEEGVISDLVKRTVSTTAKPSQRSLKSNGRPAAGNVDSDWTHDLHPLNNPTASRVSQLPHHAPKPSRVDRNQRLYSALNGSASSPALTNQFNVVAPKKQSAGLSIRGLAGPYVVMAKNFALGTTAADIESAMTPVGGVALSCRIITERPNVIAEIIFESKEGADNVVDTFNNQNADGNLLHVYHKIGGPTPKLPTPQSAPAGAPLGPRADATAGRYASRGRSPERRGEYDSRGEVMDGSFGFDDRMDTDDHATGHYDRGGGRGGLYSDNLVANGGRVRGSSGDRGRGIGRTRGYR